VEAELGRGHKYPHGLRGKGFAAVKRGVVLPRHSRRVKGVIVCMRSHINGRGPTLHVDGPLHSSVKMIAYSWRHCED